MEVKILIHSGVIAVFSGLLFLTPVGNILLYAAVSIVGISTDLSAGLVFVVSSLSLVLICSVVLYLSIYIISKRVYT